MGFDALLDSPAPGIGGACGVPVLLENISRLRPTQMAVGYREVSLKAHKLAARCGADSDAVMQKRLISVIAGPGGQLYLRDGHHLALALHRAGRTAALVSVVADLSDLGTGAFWETLDQRTWVHPFGGDGRRRPLGAMPSSVLDVEDDPFRSLAGALRRLGSYAKSAAPYADFAWAHFLRERLDATLVARDFATAFALACELGGSDTARHLPGWLGTAEVPAHPP
jgi:hypothetical protein